MLSKLFSFNIGYMDAPIPSQVFFQDSATPIMEGIVELHNEIFFFLVLILTAVSWTLFRILWLFNEKNNPRPLHFTHNTLLEVVWTVTPALVLMIIAVPSFALLYSMDEIIDPALTIKAIGHQWYWSYEYSDYYTDEAGTVAFDSYMIPEEDLSVGQFRLLEVDNRLVVPTKTHIRLIVTSTDVIHSWTIPAFGVKVDAVPGRLNQLTLFIQREGLYYGQCSEICGVNHGFMPIVVEAVDVDSFTSWLKSKMNIS
jgi:cytochrome c oxidase subunit 2